MLNLSIQRDWKRGWLLSGNDYSLKANLQIPETENSSVNPLIQNEGIPVGRVLDHFFRKVPQEFIESLRGDKSENIRGRPIESFEIDSNDKLSQGEEELFYSDGEIFEPISELASLDQLESDPFHYSLRTKFDRFQESGEIVHNIASAAQGPEIPSISPLEPEVIPALFPLRLNTVRIGAEFFRSKFVGAWFGSPPIVDSKFYVTIGRQRIEVIAWKQGASKNKNFSALQEQLLAAIDSALKETKLYDGFLEASLQ